MRPRPSRSYANLKSIHKNVDIVFVRELTEGMLYSETVVAGAPEFRPNDDITVAMRVITRKGSNRVAREAFEIARTARARRSPPRTRSRSTGWPAACSRKNAARSRATIPT